MRVLALDAGDKRIGIAVSDPSGLLATPHSVLARSNQRKDIEALLRIAGDEQAEAIIVGMPLSLDGTIGSQALRVQRFVAALAAQSPISVLTWDERYTTAEAERLMREAGLSAERRRALRDAAAAAVILQAFLDSRRAGLPR